MKKFKGLVKNAFKLGLAYRAHFFVSLIGVPLALIIYYYLWGSIFSYSGQSVLNGYTFLELITYYALSMVVGMLTYVDVDAWMGNDIKSGVVVSDFLRPISYIWNLFYVTCGFRSLAFIIEVIPTILIAIFFIKVPVPSILYFVFFLISLIFAFLLNYFLTFCVGLTAFWFKEIYGLRKIKTAIKAFLEGGLIPLTFFPLSFQVVFKFLPFQYMRFVPINFYLQKYTIMEAWPLFLIQLIWIGVFYLIAVFVYKKAFKKFAGAGV